MTVVELRFVTGVHSIQYFCVESDKYGFLVFPIQPKPSLERFGMRVVVPFLVQLAFNSNLGSLLLLKSCISVARNVSLLPPSP